MKIISVLSAMLICVPAVLFGQPVEFAEFFSDSTLRIDYYHIGDKAEEFITLDRMLVEGRWAGNPHALLAAPERGRYAVRIREGMAGRLLYTRGFDSYFGEYKTTEPAGRGVKRTFQESILVPLPRRPVTLSIELRDKTQELHPVFSTVIDPADYHIIRETASRGDTIINLVTNGDPHSKVDLVIIGEGYTSAERGKFAADLGRFAGVFFAWEPYRSMKEKFNIRGVCPSSPQSGVDEPRQGRYRRTALNSTFNSLDSDRYLLSEEMRAMRDVAGQVPYDAMLVMVNSKRYGGGGIYNAFTFFTSDGQWNEYVFQHEFAHAFAGLADEYYTTDVAYDQFFPPGVEPLEPNITALLDRSHLKWGSLVTPGIAIPTEWGQATYDSLTSARDSVGARHARRVAELRRNGAPESTQHNEELAFQDTSKALGARARSFLENHPLRGKIGAFEGGGYVPKGIYRPTVNSLMNQFNEKDKTFYQVNEEAIRQMIRYYCD